MFSRHTNLFTTLAKGDKQLQDLNIIIMTRDKFNKNFNAVVDYACQELEGEIMKLLPEGSPLLNPSYHQSRYG